MLAAAIAISTPAAPPADDLAAIADSRVRAIERRRRDIGMSHVDLLRAAGVDRDAWRDMRSGKTTAKEATIARLNAALEGQRPKPRAEAIVAFYRALMALLAKETGLNPDVVLAQDFSTERPNNPDWLRAAKLRRIAIYIAAVELDLGEKHVNARIGRAIGCSRQNIKQARDQVDELRESDIAVAALIDKCAAIVTGREAV